MGEDSMVGTIGGGQLKSPVLVESGDEGRSNKKFDLEVRLGKGS